MKNIYVLTLCWNEEKLLPFFLSHYEKFCEKIIVFDNFSTDRSPEIIKKHPKCIYETFSSDNISESKYLEIKNHAWKKYRDDADWFITVDMDEFVWFDDSFHRLVEYCDSNNFSVIQPYGYDMVLDEDMDLKFSGEFDLFQKHSLGVANESYNKPCFFNVKRVEEINLTPGGHFCDYKGSGFIYKNPRVKLLHYRYIGLDWLLNRYRSYAQRLSPENLEKRWGINYLDKEAEIVEVYRSKMLNRKPVFDDVSEMKNFLQPFREVVYKAGFFQKKPKKVLKKAFLGL